MWYGVRFRRGPAIHLDTPPASCAGLARLGPRIHVFSLQRHHVDGRVSPFGRPGHDERGLYRQSKSAISRRKILTGRAGVKPAHEAIGTRCLN